MKCNHCQAKWNAPNSQATVCPFCGKPLTRKWEINDTLPPEQVLERMFKNYGADLFKNKNQLSAMLADYLPHDKKTLRLLKFATEYNIPAQLLGVVNQNASDQTIKILTLKHNFKDEYSLDGALASYAVDCIIAKTIRTKIQNESYIFFTLSSASATYSLFSVWRKIYN